MSAAAQNKDAESAVDLLTHEVEALRRSIAQWDADEMEVHTARLRHLLKSFTPLLQSKTAAGLEKDKLREGLRACRALLHCSYRSVQALCGFYRSIELARGEGQ